MCIKMSAHSEFWLSLIISSSKENEEIRAAALKAAKNRTKEETLALAYLPAVQLPFDEAAAVESVSKRLGGSNSYSYARFEKPNPPNFDFTSAFASLEKYADPPSEMKPT